MAAAFEGNRGIQVRLAIGIVLSCLLCAPLQAKESGTTRKVTLSVKQAADAALKAVSAGDDKALRVLANIPLPDPWQVASDLLRRGEHAAALAFTAADERPADTNLHSYVQGREGKPESAEAHAALATAIAAHRARQPEMGLASLPMPREPTDTVIGITLRQQEARLRQIQDRPKGRLKAFQHIAVFDAVFSFAD